MSRIVMAILAVMAGGIARTDMLLNFFCTDANLPSGEPNYDPSIRFFLRSRSLIIDNAKLKFSSSAFCTILRFSLNAACTVGIFTY